jgi:tetratricopeptide (TPR) repeat protein
VQAYHLSGRTRLVMLDAVRSFAKENADAALLAQARERHARHFAGLAGRLAADGGDGNFDEFTVEMPNIRAALSWCQRYDPALGLRTTFAAYQYWSRLGPANESIEWIQAFARTPDGSTDEELSRIRVKTLLRGAMVAIFAGRHEAAESFVADAEKILPALADPAMQAERHLVLGSLRWSQGEHATFLTENEQALALATQAGHDNVFAPAVTNLAIAHAEFGQYVDGQRYAEEGLAHAIRAGHPMYRAMALHACGLLARMRGDYEDAGQHLHDLLALLETYDSMIEHVHCLANLAVVEAHRNHNAEAAEALAAAADLDGVHESPYTSGILLWAGAEADLAAGRDSHDRFRASVPVLLAAGELHPLLDALTGCAVTDPGSAGDAVDLAQRIIGDTGLVPSAAAFERLRRLGSGSGITANLRAMIDGFAAQRAP